MKKRTLHVTQTEDEIIIEWLNTTKPFILFRFYTYIKERIELICWTIAFICSCIVIISFILYVLLNL